MSDTPRTDQAAGEEDGDMPLFVPVDFARTLERRIAELEAERDAQNLWGVASPETISIGGGLLTAARERIAALEAERDQWRSAHNGLKAQLDMLKAGRP